LPGISDFSLIGKLLQNLDTTTSIQVRAALQKILPRVQKPGRYTGGELNQIVKNWDEIETKVALVFPDIYDIGLPNLGLAILYDLLNQRPDVLAERSYAPWTDMEELMREHQVPLYGVESLHPLKDFDIIGFSIPYESLYTNVLNVLDLAQIRLYSKDRTETDPLIIAGGHACFNPEPMHAFMDAFVIGEGEEVMLEVVECYQRSKDSGHNRTQLLRSLAEVKGVYVPSLYTVDYNPDGTISTFKPNEPGIPAKIIKRLVSVLPEPTTNLIVPNIEVVHNRVAIEIMRGCTRGCRFCHAGMITRPVRERTPETILNSIEKALEATGYEEVALLSLSSSDYTQISELVDAISTRFAGQHLEISLPSLRIDSFSVELMNKLKGSRIGGFTLAPEAASERMRQVINKPISTEQLLETAREIFGRGWTSIKLYFMIGHPSETMEDVQEIVDLCWQVYKIGRSLVGGRVKIHAGVSTFVPKPHTPFQWVAVDQIENIIEKQKLLRSSLKHPNIKVSWTSPTETRMEAWLTRGDRRLSDVIYTAWKNGAKFDAWQDYFKPQIWQEAFDAYHLSPDFYISRERSLDEILPWQHIHSGVRLNYLKQEYLASQTGKIRQDCRDQCFACGIIPEFGDLQVDGWFCPPSNKLPNPEAV
jgi:radical SAM family uncharacterized protein